MKFSADGSSFTRIFILLLGLMVVLPALNKLYTYCTYRYLGSMAYGIIDHPSSGRDIGGRPLIQYKDSSGSVHEFKSRAKTHWLYTPQKGEKVKVFMHRSGPHKVIVDNLFHYVFLPLILLVAGLYCCLYAIFGRNGLAWGRKGVTAG